MTVVSRVITPCKYLLWCSFSLVLLNLALFYFDNTVDSNQLASDKAIWSGSTLFSIQIENTFLQMECCRLTGKNRRSVVPYINIQLDKD